jgi:uncharacterized protein YraI
MRFRVLAAVLLSLALPSGNLIAADAGKRGEDIALARNSMLLHGGPSRDFPRIGLITWGQGLSVLSCDASGQWCAVEADGQRGWVPAAKLTWGEDGRRRIMRKRIVPLRVVL